MPYSVLLKGMIDALVKGWQNMEQKNMFGGIAYLCNGNLTLGVYYNWLIVRVGEETATSKVGEKGVQALDIGGKPMKGWLMVDESRWQVEEELRLWLHLARDYTATLPPQ